MSMTPYDPKNELVAAAQPDVDLAQWAHDASAVHKISQALAGTSFVPKAMQGRPDEIAAQILYGRDVNLPPMVALQQIHVIEGRPSLSALSMRGLAQSKGVKFRHDEMTETRCKISAMAPGDREWTTVSWTIDRAKKLGLTSKSNWIKQPQAMLIARATAELCRLVAAPLFLGMSYSSEELRDGTDLIDDEPPAETAPARKANQRTFKREPIKATASVPAPAAPADPGKTDDDDGDLRRTMWSRLGLLGLSDRVSRLGYITDVLHRDVQTPAELGREDLLEVLAQVDKDLPQDKQPDE